MRAATHAGSWYDNNGVALTKQLDRFLVNAHSQLGEGVLDGKTVKAVITPHAGYRFSGPTAGFSYAALQKNAQDVNRVFILGPSHHLYSTKALLTKAQELATPQGVLRVGIDETESLAKLDGFEKWPSLHHDQMEHSIELQLPFVYALYGQNPQVRVVPIVIGHTSASAHRKIADALVPYFADPGTVFIISSDFCHWGARFHYQARSDPQVPIHKGIEKLDRMGMNIIETKSYSAFAEYLEDTKNTICGRNPICVLLCMIESFESSNPDTALSLRFTHYDQSSKCLEMTDSSVSYAAGWLLADS